MAHLLTAVSHGLGLTLAQRAVNEITVFPDVQRDLALHGRPVTVDALMTQRESGQRRIPSVGTPNKKNANVTTAMPRRLNQIPARTI